jgi:hypothetical protein
MASYILGGRMLTKDQIDLYIKVDGSIDSYQLLENKLEPNETISSAAWAVIVDIIQRLVLRRCKVESKAYASETDELIEKHLHDQESLELLISFCNDKKNG